MRIFSPSFVLNGRHQSIFLWRCHSDENFVEKSTYLHLTCTYSPNSNTDIPFFFQVKVVHYLEVIVLPVLETNPWYFPLYLRQIQLCIIQDDMYRMYPMKDSYMNCKWAKNSRHVYYYFYFLKYKFDEKPKLRNYFFVKWK